MEHRIKWEMGSGYITVRYSGNKDGTITIESDPNDLWVGRSQQIVVTSSHTTSLSRTITIYQLGSYIDGGVSFLEDEKFEGVIDGGIASTSDEEYEGVIDCGGSLEE